MSQILLAIADTIDTIELVKQDDTLFQGSSRRRQTMSLDEDVPSTDDEEERADKRVKLTEATQALGEQVAALQVIFLFLKLAVTLDITYVHML